NTDADYRGAYEILVRWASVDPQIKSDIWFRTVRALGGIKNEREVDRLLDRVFDAQPERLKSVEVAVALHWPCLDRLGKVARKQCLCGAWILWWRPPGYAEIEYATATGHFARSLEIELRGRVFDPFVRGRPDKQALLTDLNEPRPGAQGKHAWLRILDDKAN